MAEPLTGVTTVRCQSLIWLKAVRAPFFTATIIPVTLGATISWYDTSSFDWIRFWFTLAGALFIHAGTNLANDYFDHLSGCDEKNTHPTLFSGGSRVIQDGVIAPEKIIRVSLLCFAIGGSIGVYLNYLCGSNVIIFLGILGALLGFFYSSWPFKIGYCGLGEIAVAVGFGPLMVLGAYYVQTQVLSLKVLFASIPVAILIALVLFINEFPDYLADKSSGKRTLVVVLGRKRAIVLYNYLLACIYMILFILVISGLLPGFCLLAFLGFPLALKAFTVANKNYNKIDELLPANGCTIGLHFITGILLCAGFIMNKFFL